MHKFLLLIVISFVATEAHAQNFGGNPSFTKWQHYSRVFTVPVAITNNSCTYPSPLRPSQGTPSTSLTCF